MRQSRTSRLQEPLNHEVSQKSYIPQLTSALGNCALQVSTLQAQFNYAMQPQESKTFFYLWWAAVVAWLGVACLLTRQQLKREEYFGDFAFKRLNSFDGLMTMVEQTVGHWVLILCMVLLNMMNIEKDLKEVVTLLHPRHATLEATAHSQALDGGDYAYYNYKVEAEYRYYVIHYPGRVEHDFENIETSLVHWPLHVISTALLVINGYDVIVLQQWTWAAGFSLVLTVFSWLKKCWDAYKYCLLRAEYLEYLWRGARDGEQSQKSRARNKLEGFWFVNTSELEEDRQFEDAVLSTSSRRFGPRRPLLAVQRNMTFVAG